MTTANAAPAADAGKKFTPDVQRFTGFLAIDGTTHKTLKAATEVSREIKVKAALLDLASSKFDDANGIGDEQELADFLYEHREAIQAALSTSVKVRKPRSPNKKSAEQPAA